MKIEFHENDYMDIYLRERNNKAYLELGKIYKEEDGADWTSLDITIVEEIKLVKLFHLLGHNIENIEDDIVKYFNNVDAFIRIKKYPNTTVIYSILNSDETQIASSTDFMDLMIKEVLKKENNASL